MGCQENSFSVFLREIEAYNRLSDEEVNSTIKLYRKSHNIEYMNKIVLSVLNFIVYRTKKFKDTKLSRADLISAGVRGIRRAVEKFDVDRGIKFLTYASYWVEMYMRREIIYYRSLVKITPRSWELAQKIAKLKKNGATDEQIAEQLHVGRRTLKNVRSLKEDISLNISLQNNPDGSSNHSDYCDLIPDSRQTPADEYSARDFIEYLIEKLDDLSEREKNILVYRFGLHGGKRMTLEQLSHIYNITSERVRQLIDISLHKLKRILEDELYHKVQCDADIF